MFGGNGQQEAGDSDTSHRRVYRGGERQTATPHKGESSVREGERETATPHIGELQ